MDRPARRISDLRPWRREPWWAEVASGVAALGWAVLALGLGYHITDLGSLRVVLTIADWPIWQVSGVMIGGMQLLAVGTDHPRLRVSIALAAHLWWMLLLIGIAMVVQTPSLALYATMAAVNVVSVWLLRPRVL